MGLVSWVVFGALAGWAASALAGTDRRQGCIGDIIVGVIGAFLGGFIMELLTGRPIRFGWSFRSFGVAVLGAIVLLVVTGATRRARRRR
jgi:uncharacterized membrane protein YeaQ/YmgE (transglycosylase-associated protein family)